MCAVLYKYRMWLLFFPPTSWLNQSVHWRSVRHIQTNIISHSQQWSGCHVQLRSIKTVSRATPHPPTHSLLIPAQTQVVNMLFLALPAHDLSPSLLLTFTSTFCVRHCPTLCTSRCPYRGLSAAIAAGVPRGSVMGPAVRLGPCDREQRGC